jgi:hypothetical protein
MSHAEEQRFIEFDRSLVNTHAVSVFEDVILECPVQSDQKYGNQDRNILETGPVPDHKAP